MKFPQQINKPNIDDFDYPLSEDRIAKFPIETRDQSKLLVSCDKVISEDNFFNLSDYLPEGSFLVLNNTKVVRARLFFKKATGATIEVFCLEPVSPVSEIERAFAQTNSAVWRCYVGNARRWKGEVLELKIEKENSTIALLAEKIEKEGDAFLIKFSWQPAEKTFSEIIENTGKIPLPPYLNRESIEADLQSYQTVYAQHDGSVAAPTAGLHFTERVFQSLAQKNITHDYLTLHVGAGTFKPVGDEGIASHNMHSEQLLVLRQLIEKLLTNKGKIIAVGTTSIRALESLYIYGVLLDKNPSAHFTINQYDPYQKDFDLKLPVEKAMENILRWMDKNRQDVIGGSTALMIMPGYRFSVISGMVTNFHQPRSTLLLLISAWLGDYWRSIYDYALQNNFRFLSYGDSCLFLK